MTIRLHPVTDFATRRPSSRIILTLLVLVGLGMTGTAFASELPVPVATVAPPAGLPAPSVAPLEIPIRSTPTSFAPSIIRLQAPVPMTIFVDGSPLAAGTTPLELSGLLPGTHQFVARAEGFRDYSFALAVQEGRITRAMLNPQSAVTRVAVQLEAEGYRNRVWRNGNRYDYHLEWNRGVLYSQIQGRLAQLGGVQVVEGGSADLALRVEFHGDDDNVQGTFTLVNAQGVVVACETHSIGMCLLFDTNMAPAAMKRASQIIDRVLPTLAGKLANRTSGTVSPPYVSVE